MIHLDDQRLNTYWQQKALTKLMGLQYKICYKKGSTNNAADALSRLPVSSTSEILVISAAQPVWLQDLQNSYADSPQASELLSGLAVHPEQGQFKLTQ